MKTNRTWSSRICGRFFDVIQSHNAILRGLRYRWGFSWILSRSKSCRSGIEISSACFDRSLNKLPIWSIEWYLARRRQSWGKLGVVQNLDRFEPMSDKIWNKQVGDGIRSYQPKQFLMTDASHEVGSLPTRGKHSLIQSGISGLRAVDRRIRWIVAVLIMIRGHPTQLSGRLCLRLHRTQYCQSANYMYCSPKQAINPLSFQNW